MKHQIINICMVSLGLILSWPSRVCAVNTGGLMQLPRDLLRGAREEVRPEGILTLLSFGAGASIARFGDSTYFDDFTIAGTLQRHATFGRRVTDFGAVVGHPAYLLPVMGATYAAGWYLGANSTREFGLLGVEALALAGLQTVALKISVNRLRPDSTDLAAFPSGHTSASFSLATVAATKWGWKVGVPACLFAGFVGYTRMESNKHYLSDVLFGAGLGIASGRAVYRVRKRAYPERYTMAPVFTPRSVGWAVNF